MVWEEGGRRVLDRESVGFGGGPECLRFLGKSRSQMVTTDRLVREAYEGKAREVQDKSAQRGKTKRERITDLE